MPEATSVISVVASVVSAIGGAVACIAAFRSAGHAKDTFNESKNAEKRFALRQLSLAAHQVFIEVDRVKWLAQGLKIEHQTLASFSGATGSSRIALYTDEIDKKVESANNLLEKAKPFIELQAGLINGPLEEISQREVVMSQSLKEAEVLREKIEMELAEIRSQNATHRNIVLSNIKGNNE